MLNKNALIGDLNDVDSKFREYIAEKCDLKDKNLKKINAGFF